MFLSAVCTLILTAPIQDPLVRSDTMLHFSKTVPVKKQTDLLRVSTFFFSNFSFLGELSL